MLKYAMLVYTVHGKISKPANYFFSYGYHTTVVTRLLSLHAAHSPMAMLQKPIRNSPIFHPFKTFPCMVCLHTSKYIAPNFGGLKFS